MNRKPKKPSDSLIRSRARSQEVASDEDVCSEVLSTRRCRPRGRYIVAHRRARRALTVVDQDNQKIASLASVHESEREIEILKQLDCSLHITVRTGDLYVWVQAPRRRCTSSPRCARAARGDRIIAMTIASHAPPLHARARRRRACGRWLVRSPSRSRGALGLLCAKRDLGPRTGSCRW